MIRDTNILLYFLGFLFLYAAVFFGIILLRCLHRHLFDLYWRDVAEDFRKYYCRIMKRRLLKHNHIRIRKDALLRDEESVYNYIFKYTCPLRVKEIAAYLFTLPSTHVAVAPSICVYFLRRYFAIYEENFFTRRLRPYKNYTKLMMGQLLGWNSNKTYSTFHLKFNVYLDYLTWLFQNLFVFLQQKIKSIIK